MSDLRFRSAETLAVNYPQRMIELVVMPYEVEADVVIDGRLVRESIMRGAFNGIQRRSGKIRVNRDHQVERTCGRVVALHPSREVGLVAELRISRTALGDETLALADDGVLDASAGYRPHDDPGSEEWSPTRDRVRVHKAWLGHVALTPDPAYETAEVLAVRHKIVPVSVEQAGTPNLDQVRGWLLADRAAQLDR